MKRISALALIATLGLAAPLSAQRTANEDRRHVVFDDADEIEGDRYSSEGERILRRRRLPRRSLLRPRTSFARELRKSLEDI
ncbi:MAG: hypothetical protein AAGE52_16790 [Myxococcota bacterium]